MTTSKNEVSEAKPTARPIEVHLSFEDVPAPQSMTFAHFSRLSDEVSMSVGYLNIPDIVAKIQASGPTGEPLIVKGRVNEQFVMSLATFATLRQRINEFAASMEKKGVKLPNANFVPISEADQK